MPVTAISASRGMISSAVNTIRMMMDVRILSPGGYFIGTRKEFVGLNDGADHTKI